MTQAAIRRMIKDSIDAAIAAEQARQANVRNDASGSGPVRGQDAAPAIHECTFSRGQEGEVCCCYTRRTNFDLWKTKVATIVPERVKVATYIHGSTDNIKGEVTSSKPADLNEACTIKCHKCGKVGHNARYCKEKSVTMRANAQPIWTCYDCGKQGQTRNRCPKKVKQEEVKEARGRAYAIKDAEPQ
nr:hypothetical protein [Tanacetum cinerariifolium]